MKSFQFKTWHFKPQWIPTLFCLALIVLLVSLGRWQWSRAEYKAQLEIRYRTGMDARSLTLSEAIEQGADVQGFPLHLSGEFDNTRSLLLDNQMEGSQAGFHVLTPMYTNENLWVLVNRGWIAGTADRRRPDIGNVRAGTLAVAGKVYFPSGKQLVLKQDDYSNPQWPLLVQKLDLPTVSKVLGVKLAPFVVRLDPGQPVEQGDELVRHWQWMAMGPEKHRAYAFQWFGMALALLILYIVFSTEKILSHE